MSAEVLHDLIHELPNAQTLKRRTNKVIDMLLEPDTSEMSDLDMFAPDEDAYKFQSHGIIETLKKLKADLDAKKVDIRMFQADDGREASVFSR